MNAETLAAFWNRYDSLLRASLAFDWLGREARKIKRQTPSRKQRIRQRRLMKRRHEHEHNDTSNA